ncbi:MAG: lysophospholipid acyltransferase family protein [Planctomycetota bacterium]|nr:lysophospholipid acyltransferase family protein [Planctomycetota bacterium]
MSDEASIPAPRERPHRAWQAHPGSALRGALVLPLTAVWALFGSGFVAVVAVVFPRWFRRKGWWMVNLWGRLPLWWHGVKMQVTGRERQDGPGPRLVLFNHVSILDLFLLAANSPPNTVVIYKQEFHKIPGIGHALMALRCVPLDRSNQAAALESMSAAAERIRAEGSTVYIAPEGTRSRKGGLQRFKLGAFHMALETGAPMVPLVMRGIPEVMPMGSFLIRSGTVAIDYLEPIDPAGWTAERIREHAAEVREVFLDYLAPVAGEE